MGFFARISLVSILVVAAAVELLLNRIGLHLITKATAPRGVARAIDVGGLFSFYLVGLLALAVLAIAIIVTLRDRRHFGVVGRSMISVAGALFLPLAVTGHITHELHAAVAPHLNTTFALFVIAIVVAGLTAAAPLRAKVGILLLALPLLLHAFWLLTQQLPATAPQGDFANLPNRLFEIGEHVVVVSGFAAFLLFVPFPRRAALVDPVPVTAALFTTAIAAVGLQYGYPYLAQAAYYGVHLNLPGPSRPGAIYLVALFAFVLTTLSLIIRPAPWRAVGMGLLLIALSGYHLRYPYQLALTLTGLLVLVRAVTALGTEGAAPADANAAPIDWGAYLERLVDGAEAVVLKHDGNQVARLRGDIAGMGLTVRLLAEGHDLLELEITLGSPPREDAPATLVRTRGARSHRVSRPSGPRVRDFDPSFSLRDHTGRVPGVLADPALRDDLARWIHGSLGIWPAEGVRYLSRPLGNGWPVPAAEVAFSAVDAPTDDLRGLIDILRTIAEKLGVATTRKS